MIEVLVPLVVFILIAVEARNREKQHYQDIRQREVLTMDLPVFSEKLSLQSQYIKGTKFVMSSITMSDDLFKYIWASMKTTFGGRIEPYELIVDRARREAILRLKESCIDADAIVNIQFCHSSIKRRLVEMVVYGTAIYWHDDVKPQRHAY